MNPLEFPQNTKNIKKKSEHLENGDNLPMLLDKIQNTDNSFDSNKNKLIPNDLNDISGINNIKNNGNTDFKDVDDELNNLNKIDLSNGQQNRKSNKNHYNQFNPIDEKNKNEFPINIESNNSKIYNNKNENNNNYNQKSKEGTEENINNKSKDESSKQENKNKMNTEEFLENNLESQTMNKEKSSSDLQKENEEPKNKNNNSNLKNTDSEFTTLKEGEKEEIILIRQLLPVSYINKIRHKDLKINKIIPKKKRVFISKLINPHDLNDNKEKEETSLPIIPKCFMTNKYIIQDTKKMMKTIINKYFFITKLGVTKEDEEEKDRMQNKVLNKKFPKVYKKAIVSPNKNIIFRTKTKLGKKHKHHSLVDINNNSNNNFDFNYPKGKKKKERISLISKDKDPNDFFNNNNNKNIIIKQNNNLIKELSGDLDGNKNIDISIQFSNKPPYGLNTTKKKLKKYPVSAKKKHKTLAENLFKDLKAIHNKLDNKDEYFKKNFLKLHYDRHVGDEKTCPICREVRKRGKKSEREKGLFSAFSLRNLKNMNRKSFSKLKISFHKKGADNDLWNNIERKKNNYDNNFFSMNNNNIDTELRQKYMQFNGMNRLNKLNRYGSTENLNNNNRYNSELKSFRNLNINNIDREMEKNDDDLDRMEYPLLKNYFHA